MPAAESIQEIPYDEWLEFVWHNPLFTRDGSFGAVIDGRVVAVSLLLANFEWGRAVSMFTGTSREHRGRGLARAVKLASIRWAAEQRHHPAGHDERRDECLDARRQRQARLHAGRPPRLVSTRGGTASGERGEDL